MISMCFYESHTFFIVFNIELCAFFHKHICQQWSQQITFFHSSLKWVSEAFENVFPQISVTKHERYYVLYCSSDSINRLASLSDLTLYKGLHTCLKASC